jgi:hypothetical protein
MKPPFLALPSHILTGTTVTIARIVRAVNKNIELEIS